MKRKEYTLDQYIEDSLKDLEFKRVWEDSEVEYQMSRQLIQKRLDKNISQRDLAKKVKTSQAAISRIESMNANPSINFLKRIAKALDSKLEVNFR